MRTLIREPLVHFLAIGAALFVVHAWLTRSGGDEGGPSDRVVRITEQDVAWLAESWSRQSMRPPNGDELSGLVTDYTRELLLAREASELGLDENDTLIRRRLAQKMQFIMQDAARMLEPGEDQLIAYHQDHSDRFQSPARVWFQQILFTGADAEARMGAAMEALAGSADPMTLGEGSLLPHTAANQDKAIVAGMFGEVFARHLFDLEPGRWHGPIESSYGTHLVFVSQIQSADDLPFTDVRDQVLEAWYIQQQRLTDERYFGELMRKYDLLVDESIKPFLSPQLSPLVIREGDSAQ